MIPVRVIGVLESCFRQKFATPRQPHLAPGSTARLRLDSDLLPEHSLDGLCEFSHVWLLFHFHLNTNKTFRPKIHPPRLKGKTVGVFATRSPHHPSPIGLTLARLEKIEGDTLYLAGIDLIDGTPIIDVKPYIPQYDSVPSAKAGWTERVAPHEMEVRFTAEAKRDMAGGARPGAFEALVRDVLSHDPRNTRDRSQMKDGKELAFLLEDCDVRFHIRGRVATVTAVERGATRSPHR